MTTELSTQKNNEMALQLNNIVDSVITQVHLKGFERAYATATAIGQLKEILTPEYLTPIMALQGNRLGVKTDKDKSGGYPMDVFKNCLIEAVLMGLNCYGNEWNIIAGNCYVTKEGLGRLLATWNGLQYTLICGTPKPQSDGKSAVIEVELKWTINGNEKKQVVPISVKMDQWTSVDALIGKATRKGRAWLASAISGIEITDGDIEDIKFTDVTPKPSVQEVAINKQHARVISHIEKESATIAELEKCSAAIRPIDADLISIYVRKHMLLSTTLEELKSCVFTPSAEDDYDLFVEYSDKLKELKPKK
jgi:hypothetical protein